MLMQDDGRSLLYLRMADYNNNATQHSVTLISRTKFKPESSNRNTLKTGGTYNFLERS